MPVKTTILIAEDTTVNRKVLVKLLSAEYALVEAENGQEALDLLRKYGNSISAVILDLIMPVLDGFGFLKAIQKMDAYKNLPLIVAADNMGDQSAVEALKLGAWDFITKPYNGDIIRFRLKNAIERSQFSAFNQLKFLAKYDTLTGIYNKTKFFQMTRKMLDANPGTLFAFLRLNIDQFQLINSFFGSEEGDKLLCFLADSFRAAYSSDTYTYGRMEADVFAACFAYSTKDAVLLHLEHAKERIKSYNRSFNIVPVFASIFWMTSPWGSTRCWIGRSWRQKPARGNISAPPRSISLNSDSGWRRSRRSSTKCQTRWNKSSFASICSQNMRFSQTGPRAGKRWYGGTTPKRA